MLIIFTTVKFNVNGSATESKTRLTHPCYHLSSGSMAINTYQIIPSAYKYYVLQY